jgi:haloalkane dehalogenase
VAENKAAWEVLARFTKPVLTLFGDSDPVTKGGERVFQERVPGTKGQPHTTIKDAGHFLQEDAPDVLVAHIHALIANTKVAA